jgi:hypothetical protein
VEATYTDKRSSLLERGIHYDQLKFVKIKV